MDDSPRLLHAICREGTPLPHTDTEAVCASKLMAVCSTFEAGEGRADEAWLADAAQRHHLIVQGIFEAGPVLPIRFGTLIEPSAIAALLESNGAGLTSELDRFEGLAEWGVKLMIVPDALVQSAEQSSEAVRTLDKELAESPPGRAYLLRRRREAAMAEALESRLAELINQVRSALAPLAIESADLPLPSVTLAGQDVVANLAYLLANGSQQEFEALADDIAQRERVELQLSGPWPPYTFVRLSIGADA